MPDLSRIVRIIQIQGVRLREASCRSLVEPSELPDSIRVKPSHQTSIVKEPEDDGSLKVDVAFQLELRSDTDEEVLQGEIRGTFELSYEVPDGEVFATEELEAFADFNAVFNAWPYWRELVQTSMARMSLPVLTVPVFRITPRDASDDSESDNGESGDA